LGGSQKGLGIFWELKGIILPRLPSFYGLKMGPIRGSPKRFPTKGVTLGGGAPSGIKIGLRRYFGPG